MTQTETPAAEAEATTTKPTKPAATKPKAKRPAAKKATTKATKGSTIDNVKAEIESKLTEVNQKIQDIIQEHFETITPLNEEAAQLQVALDALNGKLPSKRSSSSSSTGSKRGRPKGTGTRAQEAIDIITKEPGLTAGEIAEKMGINQNYLYRVLPALNEDEKIEKRGRGWYIPGA